MHRRDVTGNRAQLDQIAADEHIDYDDIHEGLLYLYRDPKRFEAGIKKMKLVQEHGQKQDVLDRFAKTIARWPEVLECYLMTGPRDYWLRVVVPDLAAYERFLKQKLTRLDGVASIESSFALEQVKYTNVLPVT